MKAMFKIGTCTPIKFMAYAADGEINSSRVPLQGPEIIGFSVIGGSCGQSLEYVDRKGRSY